MAKSKKISVRQKRAIMHLLSSPNVREAAKEAKVGERTIYRWMKQPFFLQELRKSEDQLMQDASRRLVYLSGKAIDVASDILENPDASDSNRLRAIKIVFDQILKLRSLLEVEERIANIEEYIDGIVEDSTIFQ